ncbi:MAG TPA: helix-turn-helix transcriptional regulator [Chitinophagaceae bacterium]
MNYQTYTPSAGLQSFVKCFWTLDDDGKAAMVKQRVVPDGCMEMIFHYGDLYRQFFEDGSSIIQPKSFVFGQLTQYIEIAPTGISGIVSARFLPGGLMPFLTIPVSALENKAVSLSEIFGEKGRELEEEVIAAKDNLHRIKLIETFLLSRLTDPQIIDNIIKTCVDVVFETRGQLGMKEMADKVNINRRNMQRKFTTAVGLSPKQLSRVVRLQAAIKMLAEQNFNNLTSLAYENGYYDQAHFIRDFKVLTGISPKLFFGENMKFAALFASAD